MNRPTVVELLGMARHRAGRAEVVVEADTVGRALRLVVAECPGLAGLVGADGSVARQFLVSINGERFVDDVDVLIPAGGRIVVVGADAGG